MASNGYTNGYTNGHSSTANSFSETDYDAADIIKRDFCVIGGGSTGTYTSVRLKDYNKSLVLVEKNDRLGGHAETYRDPASGVTLDIGVIVFGHLKEVKDYFQRFDIPLKKAEITMGAPDYVDFNTGKVHDFKPPGPEEIGAAMHKYVIQLMSYPEVQAGFALKYPVSEDLLLPFGEYVKKYQLQGMIQAAFSYCQGYMPFLELSTLYVMKYWNADLLNTLSKGFLMTEMNNIGELYSKAVAFLGQDVLLSSRIVSMDRSSTTDFVKVVVCTPTGNKLIVAKKIISTIPHHKHNLAGFDLSDEEDHLFSQFTWSGFWAGVLKNTGLTQYHPIHAYGPEKAHGIPDMPSIYAINPSRAPGLYQFYYGGPGDMSEEEVKKDVIESLKRIQKERSIETTSDPEIVKFANHTPFNLIVPNRAIRDGFYDKLYALQGQRHTWYNGASFHAQDSSVLWRFTEALLPRILESVE